MTPAPHRYVELATLVGVWRSARCPEWPPLGCEGDNHERACPVSKALDDVIAAHNALGAPGMGP